MRTHLVLISTLDLASSKQILQVFTIIELLKIEVPALFSRIISILAWEKMQSKTSLGNIEDIAKKNHSQFYFQNE